MAPGFGEQQAGFLVGFVSGVPWYVYSGWIFGCCRSGSYPGAPRLASAPPGDVYCYFDRYYWYCLCSHIAERTLFEVPLAIQSVIRANYLAEHPA